MTTFVSDDELDEIVDEITEKQFVIFCGWDGCNETILDGIRQKVKQNISKQTDLFKKGLARIIAAERLKLIALYHSEKVLYETIDEEDEKKKDSKNEKYFEYLCSYQKDEDLSIRVRGLEMRGKKYKVSKDGSCPSCCYKSNVFVILDFLFPAGDMPEILTYLLGQGKAILWSSKQNMKCKDPPTFLCNGKCPFSDVLHCGFNINWKTTDLAKIFLFPNQNYVEAKITKNTQVGDSTPNAEESFDDEYEIYEEGLVDIDYYRNEASWFVIDEYIEDKSEVPVEETSMIRTMLALEQARHDFVNGEMKYNDCDTDYGSSISKEEDSSEEEQTIDLTRGESDNESDGEEIESQESPPPPIPSDQPESNPPPEPPAITNPGETKQKVDVAPLDVEIYDLDEEGKPKVNDEDDFVVVIPSTETQTLDPSLNNVFANAQKVVNSVGVAPSLSGGVVTTTETAASAHVLKSASYYEPEKQKTKPVFTAADFPVSTTGACPYCYSQDVIYIILKENETDEEELPQLLRKLLKDKKAEIRVKGEYDLPSFQCRTCTYGFNLDWAATNLEKIFLTPKKSETAVTATTTNTAAGYSDYNAYYAQQSAYQNPYMAPMTFMPNAWGGMVPVAWQGFPSVLPAVPGMVTSAGFLPPVIAPGIVPPYYQQPYQWNQTNMWGYPPPPPSGVQSTNTTIATLTTTTTTAAENVPATDVIDTDMDLDENGGAASENVEHCNSSVTVNNKNFIDLTAERIAPVETEEYDNKTITENNGDEKYHNEKCGQNFEEKTTPESANKQSTFNKELDNAEEMLSSQPDQKCPETGPVSTTLAYTSMQKSNVSDIEKNVNKTSKVGDSVTCSDTQEINSSIDSRITEEQITSSVTEVTAKDSSSTVLDKLFKVSPNVAVKSSTESSAIEDPIKASPNIVEKPFTVSTNSTVNTNTPEEVSNSAQGAIVSKTTDQIPGEFQDIFVNAEQDVADKSTVNADGNHFDEKPQILELINPPIQSQSDDTPKPEDDTGMENRQIVSDINTNECNQENDVIPDDTVETKLGNDNAAISVSSQPIRNSKRLLESQLTTDETIQVQSKRPFTEEAMENLPCNEINSSLDNRAEQINSKGGNSNSEIKYKEDVMNVRNIDTGAVEVDLNTSIDETPTVSMELALTELPSQTEKELSHCETSIEEILSEDDTTRFLAEPTSPSDKLFSIDEHHVSKIRNDFLSEESLDATSPFTDSLLNIVSDSSELKEKDEKDYLFNGLSPNQTELFKEEPAAHSTALNKNLSFLSAHSPLNTPSPLKCQPMRGGRGRGDKT